MPKVPIASYVFILYHCVSGLDAAVIGQGVHIYLSHVESGTGGLEIPLWLLLWRCSFGHSQPFWAPRDECDFTSWELLRGQSSLLFSLCLLSRYVWALCARDVSAVCWRINLGNASRMSPVLLSPAPVHVLTEPQRSLWPPPSRRFLAISFLGSVLTSGALPFSLVSCTYQLLELLSAKISIVLGQCP